MPLRRYGILKGKAIEVRLGAGSSPHYQVRLVDDTTDYRIAVNVQSKLAPSELEYLVVDRYRHPITAVVEALPLGYTAIQPRPTGGAMDYIRGNLFDRTLMRPLPFNVPGPDNDLNDKIDRVMQRAVADEDALVYAQFATFRTVSTESEGSRPTRDTDRGFCSTKARIVRAKSSGVSQ